MGVRGLDSLEGGPLAIGLGRPMEQHGVSARNGSAGSPTARLEPRRWLSGVRRTLYRSQRWEAQRPSPVKRTVKRSE